MNVKSVVIGLMVGAVLATIPAFASGTWTSVDKFVERGEDYQAGYIEGASDLLSILVADGADNLDYGFLKKLEVCMDRHSQATRRDLRRWAIGAANQVISKGHGNDSAAAAIIAQACN